MNGQEKDNEVFKGAMAAEYWEYDSRIGRRWEQDPITYPWQSPYATFNNNPVYYSDPSGLEGDPPVKKGDKIVVNGKEEIMNAPEAEIVFNRNPLAASTSGVETLPQKEVRDLPNNPTNPENLVAVTTGQINYIRPGQHLAFKGRSSSAGAGMGLVGADITGEQFTFYKSDNNIHTLRRNYTIDFISVNGNNSSEFGTGVSYNYLYGDMYNIDPFEDPGTRLEVANDISVSATIGFIQAGYNGGDINNGGYSANSFGVAVGLALETRLKPISANLPGNISGGLKKVRVSARNVPSIYDSIEIAKKHRSNSRSEGILKRYNSQ